MNDEQFIRLLNEYLDDTISSEDLVAFREALRQSPGRRSVFRQHRLLHAAQRVISARRPRYAPPTPVPFSIGRLFQCGPFLVHTAVFLFAISPLFHVHDTPDTTDNFFTSSQSTAATKQDGSGKSTPTPATVETENNFANDASAPVAEPIDLGSIMPADEYGFVRL
ncbi:MAG: hypothetical protein LBS59_06800 [Puniceicoccales bacterium]|jgi:hypothetical protein|nr:hypothetical protein [Puniceicoccales bacterium]